MLSKRALVRHYQPCGIAPVAAWSCPRGDASAELSDAGGPSDADCAEDSDGAGQPRDPGPELSGAGGPSDLRHISGYQQLWAACAEDSAGPGQPPGPGPPPRLARGGRVALLHGACRVTLATASSASRGFKIAGIVAAVFAGAALASASATAARGAPGHSGDGALEERGRLNMKAFSGRMSVAALPSLRKSAGLPPSSPDDDVEKAEAAAFLLAAEGGAPRAGLHVSGATSAAINDARKALGIFTMRSSSEGSSGGSASCAPVAATCGEGGPECCAGSRCDEEPRGRCRLALPAPVPQDLENTSSGSGSVEAEAANVAVVEPAAEWQATRCAESGLSCLESRCCAQPGHTCFRQHDWWASCNATCSKNSTWDPGQKAWVRVGASGGGWSCEVVAASDLSRIMHVPAPSSCADSGDQCASSRCCSRAGSRCYRKDEYWASCNATCSPYRKWDEVARAWVGSDKKEWECEELLPGGGAPAEEESRSAGGDVMDYLLK